MRCCGSLLLLALALTLAGCGKNATASVHVSNILSKLGVSNRVEATTRALRHNLVD